MTTVTATHTETVLSIPKGSQIKLKIDNQSQKAVNEVRWNLDQDSCILYGSILPGTERVVNWKFSEDRQQVNPKIKFAYRFANLPSDAGLNKWDFRLETDKENFLSSLVLTILSDTNTVCRVECYNSNELLQEFVVKKNSQIVSSSTTPVLTPLASSPPIEEQSFQS